ncbi:MAG: carbamoyltransferase HypF [Chloroflexota bacterium]
MSSIIGARIHITGIVQGVGFRPFVYGLAMRSDLKGWVRNTSAGVDIEIDGDTASLEKFIHALKHDAPPLARIDSFDVIQCSSNGFSSFDIIKSEPVPGAFIPVSPDVSICDDCLDELFNPKNHRYLYPFINCTNCGPRFTIIKDLPYDRPNTTMSPFEMCPTCRTEYEDPINRRFHAQPVACPACGPKVWIEDPTLNHQRIKSPIQHTQNLLQNGKIVAIKGLGGFHLACDAANPEAVHELRNRKYRIEKPFALMMPDIKTVQQHCHINDDERYLLESHQRPIVLLKRKPDSPLPDNIAPGQNLLGVMLPYTPLHYLIFAQHSSPNNHPHPLSVLVMTSANLSEEPIAYINEDARQRLGGIADAFLMNDRQIHVRCDDSVIRTLEHRTPESQTRTYPFRRSRGFAPDPITTPFEMLPILATGSELKNTFCLTKNKYAFLSHHIGDLENYETLVSFEKGIKHFENLFRIHPETIAYDLHPNYLATRYALSRAEKDNLPSFGIQHHHAHIAACMSDNGLNGDEPVIGVAFDGTGYGDDGAIWGGEFLLADYTSYQRFAHLAYAPLPGGDAAIRNPGRMALAHLWQAGLPWENGIPPVDSTSSHDRHLLRSMLNNKLSSPFTSSIGRLFDAVAALSGLRQKINFEAQAAIELEALADPFEQGSYPFEFNDRQLDPTPMFQSLIADLRAHTPISSMSAKFHNGLSKSVVEICSQMRTIFSVNTVALSGGVWQNITLLTKTYHSLEKHGFNILTHRNVPTNDGGLSLGQAVIANQSV